MLPYLTLLYLNRDNLETSSNYNKWNTGLPPRKRKGLTHDNDNLIYFSIFMM